MYAFWNRPSHGRYARVIHREVELTGVTACGVVIPAHATRVAKVASLIAICGACRTRFKDHRRRAHKSITHEMVQDAIAQFSGQITSLPPELAKD